MKKILLVSITAISIVGLALWRPWDSKPLVTARPVVNPSSSPHADPTISLSPPPRPAVVEPPPEAVKLPALTAIDRQRVLDSIDNLEFTLRDFASSLGGNPVGTNAEITAALLGDNAKQIKLPIPQGSSINSLGELCDPWGNPWFFHQLSGKKTELHSAGPDGKMWNDDDVVH